MNDPEETQQPTPDEAADSATDTESPPLALEPGDTPETPLLPPPMPGEPPAVSRLMAQMAMEAADEVAATEVKPSEVADTDAAESNEVVASDDDAPNDAPVA